MNLLSIFKPKPKFTDVDWLVGILANKDVLQFMQLLNSFFTGINEDFNTRQGSLVTLKTGDVVNLLGVAKTCATLPKNQWEKAIQDYLSPLILQQRQLFDYLNKAKVFLNVQSDLRLRIVSGDYDPGAAVSSLPFIKDLFAGLYLDTGALIVGVTEDLITEWGLNINNLHDIAVSNLKKFVELKAGVLEKENLNIKAGFSKDLMASGYLKIIPDLFDYKDAKQIIFAIPSMEYIFYQSEPTTQQIELMRQVAKDVYVKASKPLTESLILYSNGEFSYL